MKISMNGAEWFSTRAGGLNRYFECLAKSLGEVANVQVNAVAFGDAATWGRSWGPLDQSTASRFLASRQDVGVSTDIVDTHFALYSARPRKKSGTIYVRHFQGPWASESEATGASSFAVTCKRVFERFVYAQDDHFIVLCDRFAKILSDDYSVDSSAISVIPPGVDLSQFSQVEADRKGNLPWAICVRRLERRMGIDVLIRSWALVVSEIPQARLEIVGTGSMELELKALVVSLGLGASITLSGRLSDSELSRAYERATISVVPSLALEGFGLIALESLATGAPAIVTDCGGLPDSVNGLDSTLVVRPNDPGALGARIVSAFRGKRPSPDECRRHAETFSWERAALAHASLYGQLIAKRAADAIS
ncbi:glycosyltransferase family 4 protein [Cryobacterium ruanii]|nr:glycosyltransferase family 4 protein [Cryobacterium ruanii]